MYASQEEREKSPSFLGYTRPQLLLRILFFHEIVTETPGGAGANRQIRERLWRVRHADVERVRTRSHPPDARRCPFQGRWRDNSRMRAIWHLMMWMRPGNPVVFPQMLEQHEPLIVNIAGHLAGAIVFGIFLVLALRSRPGRRLRQSWLSIASAGLAWLWNAGSLTTLLLGAGRVHWALEAASFCSLSLLPAVLLHLSLNGRLPVIAKAGYFLSAVATALHLCEDLAPGMHLHKWAIWIVTFGFGALTLVCTAGLLRQGKETRGRTSQLLASMCLLLFAVSLSHFVAGHPPQAWKEVIVHHAGIPLALVILLQDYRFVFADAFVRFLANVLLAVSLSYGAIRLAASLTPEDASIHPLADVLGVAALCGLLIGFAYLRAVLQRWLTRWVFRAGRMEAAIPELRTRALAMRDENAYLGWAAGRLAAQVGTANFEVVGPDVGLDLADLDYPSVADENPQVAHNARWDWAEVIVPIRLPHGEVHHILLGCRPGGRRYLSEDLRSLNYLANVVAEGIERFHAAEMQRLVSEAELRALHSQINPHFLFNALNTIYGIIPREAAAARRTVLNLADLFRYFLQSDKILIPLSEELKIVKAYLEIERLRLGPRLQTMLQVDPAVEQTPIPVLSIQPLVENAIKHGLARRSDEGWLKVTANACGGRLTVTIEDSGAAEAGDVPAAEPAGAGVGIANVSRRLQLCFGPDTGVTMTHGAAGTRVQFSVPMETYASAVP